MRNTVTTAALLASLIGCDSSDLTEPVDAAPSGDAMDGSDAAGPPDGPTHLDNNVLVSEGDSISVTWGGNHTGMYANLRAGTVTHHGLAVGGSSVASMTARASGVTDKMPEALTVLIGANDLGGYSSPEAFVTALYAYTDPMRAQGIKVAVATVLPMYVASNATYTATHNSFRASVNTTLRGAVGTKIDAVIDFAADAEMGPDVAAQDVSLYHDGIHPTDGCGFGCGGQGKLAAVYRDAVDVLLGVP